MKRYLEPETMKHRKDRNAVLSSIPPEAGTYFPARISGVSKILAVLIFLGFSAISPAPAQLISISAQFDTTSIWIGEHTLFTISVVQPREMHVEFPQLRDTLSQRIEILTGHPADTVTTDDGKLRITRSYTVTSFYGGEHYAEALPFAFMIDDDENVLLTRRARLEVMAPEVDSGAGIYDIKDPLGIPVGLLEVIPWVLAIVAIGFIIWYLFRYYRKQKVKSAEPDAAKPEEPAHATALRNLKELRKEALWQKGRVKEYYTRMTEIVRIYIERRFGIMAMELTSDEILTELKNLKSIDSEVFKLLEGFFTTADLVKFAKARPGEAEHENALDTAFRFVKATCSNTAGSGPEAVPEQSPPPEGSPCEETR